MIFIEIRNIKEMCWKEYTKPIALNSTLPVLLLD